MDNVDTMRVSITFPVTGAVSATPSDPSGLLAAVGNAASVADKFNSV